MRKDMLRYHLKTIIENGEGKILGRLTNKDDYVFNREYLVPAVENDFVLKAELAEKLYQKDKALFAAVLLHTNNPFRQYYNLPGTIRKDHRTAITILTTSESIQKDQDSLAFHLSKEIVTHSSLRRHIPMLMKFASNGDARAGGDVWNDKAAVVSLCKFRGGYLSFVSNELKADPYVLRVAFSTAASVSRKVIDLVPQNVFVQHHDIAALAVKACRPLDYYNYYSEWRELRSFTESIGKDVLAQPEVLLEWIRKGWRVSFILPYYAGISDEMVALEAMKYCGDSAWEFNGLCRRISSKLGNKEFMISAVEKNPVFIKKARRALLKDKDFVLRVVSLGRQALSGISHTGEEFHTLVDCAVHIRARLAVTNAFVSRFLAAIAIDPPESTRAKRRHTCRGREPRCHLRMLDDAGPESRPIKAMIADFAGVPIGLELAQLRTALDTLQFWGY